MNGELDVGPTGFHTDLAHHGDGGVAHPLVFLVGQRLRRRHRDRVSRMHSHGIDVLDRTDDDHVVIQIAHYLHFIFFPTDNRLFDQHFVNRGLIQSVAHQHQELIAVVGDGRSAPPQRKTGSHDAR